MQRRRAAPAGRTPTAAGIAPLRQTPQGGQPLLAQPLLTCGYFHPDSGPLLEEIGAERPQQSPGDGDQACIYSAHRMSRPHPALRATPIKTSLATYPEPDGHQPGDQLTTDRKSPGRQT